MADADMVPGVWQGDSCAVVLAHVAHCVWKNTQGAVVSYDSARPDQVLHVQMTSGKDFSFIEPSNGISFLRALNLYWETRA